MVLKGALTRHIEDDKYRIVFVYCILVLISLISLIGVNVFVISNSIDKKRDDFVKHSLDIQQNIIQVTQSTNFILDGFSSLVSSVGMTSYQTLVQYSDRLLERVPFIYQVQAAQRVEREQLAVFTEEQSVYENFSVKVFDGAGFVGAENSSANAFYPLTFFADKEGSEFSTIGIDVMSFPFLALATRLSAQNNQTVFSEPFDTVDEHRVFVMVQPAYFEQLSDPDFFVFFIIRSDILIKNKSQYKPFTISLGVKGQEELLVEQQQQLNDSSFAFLPEFNYQKEIAIGDQLLDLQLKHQMTWSSVNTPLLIVVWSASILILFSFFFMFRMHFRSELVKVKQSRQLYEMAHFDGLTQLANRRFFTDSLNHAVKTASRRKSKIAVLYLDLDGFKEINDTFGHEAGDEALIMTAQKIKAAVRDIDVVGRLGGDEFAVILTEIADEQDCIEIERRLSAGIESINRIGDYQVKLGTSIGCATYPKDAKAPEELMSQADERMYKNKRARKAKQIVDSEAP